MAMRRSSLPTMSQRRGSICGQICRPIAQAHKCRRGKGYCRDQADARTGPQPHRASPHQGFRMTAVTASHLYYIKLGRGGDWEAEVYAMASCVSAIESAARPMRPWRLAKRVAGHEGDPRRCRRRDPRRHSNQGPLRGRRAFDLHHVRRRSPVLVPTRWSRRVARRSQPPPSNR